MYTSGCPKNQNKCWNRIGSPPPEGLKKEDLIFRSVKSIVIAAARTGRDKRSRVAVIITAQENNVIFLICMWLIRIFKMVVIKLIAPKIEETPARWREKIDRSTEEPIWPVVSARGG
jgi:hypothetical protein